MPLTREVYLAEDPTIRRQVAIKVIRVETASSTSINPGHSTTNTIAVVANGKTLTFYVNHTNIASITDSTYAKGYVGMIAEDMNTSTEVIYTNARLWTI